ncbi:MAG: DoxX family protein [Acidobacteriota bacterium]
MTINILSRLATPMYNVMRIALGLLFACHGAQKLFGWFGGQKATLASLMGMAGVIEFFGGLLIAVGLVTQIAAFICAGEMAVAYFMAHAANALLPIQNQGELALLYMFAFLYIMAHGGGLWSIDAYIGGPAARSKVL